MTLLHQAAQKAVEARMCPFCGTTPGPLLFTRCSASMALVCNCCGARGPLDDTEPEAAAAWNRSQESALQQQPEPVAEDPKQWKQSYFNLRHVMQDWHAQALAAGFDGVPDVLLIAAEAANLFSALNAMLTQFGMDEDEWSRPTFKRAKDAIEQYLAARKKVAAPPALQEVPREPVARWHELKTDPDVFDAVADGRKTFEIRLNDRDFRFGDGLLLRRTLDTGWAMKNTGAPLEYTGEELRRVVSHVLHGPVYGLAAGWVILSLAASPSTTQQQEVGSGAQYRHKRTGGLYAVIGTAKLQTDKPLFDMAEVVAYRGEDGRVWVRAAAEFDERFERAAAPSTPEKAGGVLGTSNDQGENRG